MSSINYRTSNNSSRPTKYNLCAVVALAATVAILGSFKFVSSSSIAAALVDDQGDIAITGDDDNKKYYILTKFEISGKVQGVSFRRYTKNKANELGLMGWCRNTPRGTVEGEYEYEVSGDGGSQAAASSINESESNNWRDVAFRHWLCHVGSPKSNIERCTFSEEEASNGRMFNEFRVTDKNI